MASARSFTPGGKGTRASDAVRAMIPGYDGHPTRRRPNGLPARARWHPRDRGRVGRGVPPAGSVLRRRAARRQRLLHAERLPHHVAARSTGSKSTGASTSRRSGFGARVDSCRRCSCCLPVVAVTTAIARPEKLAATGRQVLYALLYVANWTTIARGDDYFQRFSGPGRSTTSGRCRSKSSSTSCGRCSCSRCSGSARASRRGRRVPLAAVTLVLTVASDVGHRAPLPPARDEQHARLRRHGRARGFAARRSARGAGDPVRARGDVSGAGASRSTSRACSGSRACSRASRGPTSTRRFCTAAASCPLRSFTAVLAVAASHPNTLVARALGLLPLRWVGARSYGIYLWHLPVVAFMPSTVLIERPVAARRGAARARPRCSRRRRSG